MERADPLRYFSILVTSFFQCALHTPRSSMQSRDWASQGKTWLLHQWQLYQKCPPLHFKIYLAILYSCFWGWKVFQFYYEMDTKMVFLTRKWRQALSDKQELCEAQPLCDVCPKWEDFFHIWRQTESVRKRAVSSERTQITTHSDSKRLKNHLKEVLNSTFNLYVTYKNTLRICFFLCSAWVLTSLADLRQWLLAETLPCLPCPGPHPWALRGSCPGGSMQPCLHGCPQFQFDLQTLQGALVDT